MSTLRFVCPNLRNAESRVKRLLAYTKEHMARAAVFIDGSSLVSCLSHLNWPAFIDPTYLSKKLVKNDDLVAIIYSFSESKHKSKRFFLFGRENVQRLVFKV